MIKKSKLKLPSTSAIVFNGGALLVVGSALVLAARSSLFEASSPPCSERYQIGTRLELDRKGVPLTADEMQARLGNTDWGLVEGGRVVKLKSGPAGHALEVDLATAPAAGARLAEDERHGIGFKWSPRDMDGQSTACLSYSVFIPEDFAFGKGGRLPGLMGNDVTAVDDSKPSGFSSLFTWSQDGAADIQPKTADRPEGRPISGARREFRLERGRWMHLEQEVVLNQPGAKDGSIRAWLDGRMIYQAKGLSVRDKADIKITGVLAESVAGDQPADAAKSNQKLWMTPFVLHWQ